MAVRRRLIGVVATLALTAPVTGGSAAGEPGIGGFMSPNVTWQGTIPLDVPGIGADVVHVGGRTRFYVTGLRGLSIYDVTNPMIPIPLGHLELPHFENENVAVAADGSLAVITSDLWPHTYLIDTTIPTVPRIAGIIPDGSHTATCSDRACSHLYGSRGWVYDIRDRAAPKKIEQRWSFWTHAAELDAAGYLMSANLEMFDPRPDPAHPRLVARRGPADWETHSWGHNNVRPDADKWRPRRAGDNGPALRPGELLVSGGESLVTVECPGWSGITTWTMANWDQGQRFTPLDSFFPKKGDWVDGNPGANALGCSSHWFEYRKGIVAAGWYENGIRFFDIHRTTGRITEVGWFQPVATEAWAAYWIDDEYVYTLDAVRGIDILKFDRDAPRPTQRQSDASWRLDPNRPLTFVTLREKQLCSLAQRRSA